MGCEGKGGVWGDGEPWESTLQGVPRPDLRFLNGLLCCSTKSGRTGPWWSQRVPVWAVAVVAWAGVRRWTGQGCGEGTVQGSMNYRQVLIFTVECECLILLQRKYL